MLLEIYQSMLSIAKNVEVPTGAEIEIVFNINTVRTSNFWADKKNALDFDILILEWDSISSGKYTKIFYGIRFVIQFNYEKTTQ